jgi:predicted metal-dependent phosphotriesterase family hydrolase
MAYVNTVLGPIHPNELGPTGAHEHVVWGPPGWDYDPEWWFHYPRMFAKCLADLAEYRELGGKTIVCCSGIGLGRDIEFCRILSRYSGVQIVVPTAFWAAAGMYNYFLDKDVDYFTELFVRELTQGIGKTGIKAGHIKVGIGRTMSEADTLLHRAAARAAKRTGAVVTSHCAWGALDVLDVMKSEGLDLSRVIISHCSHGEAMDAERDKKVASMGAWISYDSFSVTNTWAVTHYAQPDEKRADLVKHIIDAGFKHRMLLSSDNNLFSLGWSRSSPYVGKATSADFLRFTPGKLRRVGISEETFWSILTENPKRAFAID